MQGKRGLTRRAFLQRTASGVIGFLLGEGSAGSFSSQRSLDDLLSRAEAFNWPLSLETVRIRDDWSVLYIPFVGEHMRYVRKTRRPLHNVLFQYARISLEEESVFSQPHHVNVESLVELGLPVEYAVRFSPHGNALEIISFLKDASRLWTTGFRHDRLHITLDDQPLTVDVLASSQPVFDGPLFTPIPIITYAAEEERVRFTAYVHAITISNLLPLFSIQEIREALPPVALNTHGRVSSNALDAYLLGKECSEEKALGYCRILPEYSAVGILDVHRDALPSPLILKHPITDMLRQIPLPLDVPNLEWRIHPSALQPGGKGVLPLSCQEKRPVIIPYQKDLFRWDCTLRAHYDVS